MNGNLDKLSETVESGGNTSTNSDDDDDTEYPDYPNVKLTPDMAFTGVIEGISFYGDYTDEQNILNDDGWNDQVILTLTEPDATHARVLQHEEYDGDETVSSQGISTGEGVDGLRDYRFVDDSEDLTDEENGHVSEWAKKVDGEWTDAGFEVRGTKFPGVEVDNLDEDGIEVWLSGNVGLAAARTLDAAAGAATAWVDEETGDKNSGLIEYAPNDSDLNDRIASYPVLHPELEGEEIVVFLREADNDAYRINFLFADADSVHECTPIGRNGVELDDATADLEREPYLVWSDEFDGSSSTDSASTDSDEDFGFSESESTGSTEQPDAYEDLTDSQRQFIDTAVENASDDTVEASFEDFEKTVERNVEDDRIDPIEPTVAKELVEERL